MEKFLKPEKENENENPLRQKVWLHFNYSQNVFFKEDGVNDVEFLKNLLKWPASSKPKSSAISFTDLSV